MYPLVLRCVLLLLLNIYSADTRANALYAEWPSLLNIHIAMREKFFFLALVLVLER